MSRQASTKTSTFSSANIKVQLYSIERVSGKYLYTADTLSRAPLHSIEEDDTQLQEKIEGFAEGVIH